MILEKVHRWIFLINASRQWSIEKSPGLSQNILDGYTDNDCWICFVHNKEPDMQVLPLHLCEFWLWVYILYMLCFGLNCLEFYNWNVHTINVTRKNNFSNDSNWIIIRRIVGQSIHTWIMIHTKNMYIWWWLIFNLSNSSVSTLCIFPSQVSKKH